MNQKGQILLILILVITVALAIGLSIVQKSLLDVSTSTKVEQSTKAFSAAEAGIEKALQSDSPITSPITIGENATLEKVQVNQVPYFGQALEYPPISKEELAHVWLADPDSLAQSYSASNLDIYWGNDGITCTTPDAPAIAITVVYQDTGSNYKSKKYLIDQCAVSRNNGFIYSDTNCLSPQTSTSLSQTDKKFYCKKNIDVSSAPEALPNLSKLMLLRARLLYNTTSQPFAVKPALGHSLPVQGRLFTSTGTSGDTQRRVQVFKLDKVVPPYFDYAIFSVGEIKK